MDMDSKNFTALPAFSKKFDGQGLTISNLTLKAQTGGTTLGLFASLANGANVQNLTIENVTATADGLTGGMGFLAGAASGATITVEGVEIVGENNQIGGLNAENVGGLIGLISGTSTNATITGKSTPAMKEAFSSSANSFIAIKKVSGKANLGGVVGKITSKSVVIKGYCLPKLAKFELAGTPSKVQYGTVGTYVGSVNASTADVTVVDETDKASHLTNATQATTVKPTTDYWNPQTADFACMSDVAKTELMFTNNFIADGSAVKGYVGVKPNYVGYSPAYKQIKLGTVIYQDKTSKATQGATDAERTVNIFSKAL